MNKVRALLVLVLALIISTAKEAWATHLRAGEIIVERIDCAGLTFKISVIVYTDSEGPDPVLFGGGILDFGDGQQIELPVIQNNEHYFAFPDGTKQSIANFSEDLGDNVAKAAYTIQHTYSSARKYVIGYAEQNRNGGILNIENEPPFYVETEIIIDGFLGCNNTPVLLIPPIDRACPGVAFYHNPGAYDPDGDSIAFELVQPKKSIGVNVGDYRSPASSPFSVSNEEGTGPPTFSIDPITGDMEWNAPDIIGEYNVAFIIKEYRFIAGEWEKMGYVTRDMQIIVEDCENERPYLEMPEDICVEAGETVNATIRGIDPDGHNVQIKAFSQVLTQGAFVTPVGDPFQTSPAEVTFTWETECFDIREQPYAVEFRITDKPNEGPNLVDFETLFITVVGPKPILNSVEQDGQALKLEWDSYACQNAELIQVWRRVDSNPYQPDSCETGMRDNAGYFLIDELTDTNLTSYRDTDVAAGAKYCYRLVAIFPQPKGGKSKVSDELCYEFVPAKKPIITHVTVDRTDAENGEITLAWREPFELGTLSYPLTYNIYRATGLSGGNMVLINSKEYADGDTTFYTDTGLNTLDNAYHYEVAVVDPSGSAGEEEVVSAPASSVRLEPTPLFEQIKLDWQAIVPWSNTMVTPPHNLHPLYRGEEGATEEELSLLDEVDVLQYGFSYVDSTDLDNDQVYCYRVMTKGTYGNPAIDAPQFNYSQIVCAQPSDTIPPCEVNLNIEGPACDSFSAEQLCNFENTIFRNFLSWSADFGADCQEDIKEYQVFFATDTQSEYQFLTATRDTTFQHERSDGFAGCYKVKVIDRSGNESEFSNEFCVDNCGYYELPNIITPDNNDGYNDVWRAFGPESLDKEDADPSMPRCARFVRAVDVTVYNRWGKAVYHYQGSIGDENGIFINWNGRSDTGQDLASGVYYYLAKVTFDSVNPADAVKNIKGWVQIVR